MKYRYADYTREETNDIVVFFITDGYFAISNSRNNNIVHSKQFIAILNASRNK